MSFDNYESGLSPEAMDSIYNHGVSTPAASDNSPQDNQYFPVDPREIRHKYEHDIRGNGAVQPQAVDDLRLQANSDDEMFARPLLEYNQSRQQDSPEYGHSSNPAHKDIDPRLLTNGTPTLESDCSDIVQDDDHNTTPTATSRPSSNQETIKVWRRGVYVVQGADSSGMLKCKVCNEPFRTPEALESHKTVHNMPCDVCGKVFFGKTAVRNHRRIHFTERWLECKICHSKIQFPGHLERHELKHRDKSLWPAETKCPHCEERRSRAHRLQDHIRKEHPEEYQSAHTAEPPLEPAGSSQKRKRSGTRAKRKKAIIHNSKD